MLKVLKSGVYSSIQDLGRFGHASNGVPVSGSMDNYSAKLANLMLDNAINDAVLEVTYGVSSFQFLKNTIICIAGADLNSELNGVLLPCNHIIKVEANSIINFKEP